MKCISIAEHLDLPINACCRKCSLTYNKIRNIGFQSGIRYSKKRIEKDGN